MALRIGRAKRNVSGVRFDQPGGVATALRVLYLIFNVIYPDAETDRAQIVEWYDELVRLTGSPVARLNGPSRCPSTSASTSRDRPHGSTRSCAAPPAMARPTCRPLAGRPGAPTAPASPLESRPS